MSHKTTVKRKKRDAQKAAIVQRVAKLAGCSTSLVYKVWDGERQNASVEALVMEYVERLPYFENELVKSIQEKVPFN